LIILEWLAECWGEDLGQPPVQLVDVDVDTTVVGDVGSCRQAVLFVVDLAVSRRGRFAFGYVEREEVGVFWKGGHGVNEIERAEMPSTGVET
jgi:hypothetical protein